MIFLCKRKILISSSGTALPCKSRYMSSFQSLPFRHNICYFHVGQDRKTCAVVHTTNLNKNPTLITSVNHSTSYRKHLISSDGFYSLQLTCQNIRLFDTSTQHRWLGNNTGKPLRFYAA